jgi:Cytochrome P450
VISELEEGEFDLIANVANPIPTVVIAELLGVDAELHEQFKIWSDASSKGAFGPANDSRGRCRCRRGERMPEWIFETRSRKGRSLSRPGSDEFDAQYGAD